MLPVSLSIAKRSMSAALSPAEAARFSRHLLLPEVGQAGQKKLKVAKVLVIGAGGLGSPVSLYLAAAGIGTIGLVDFDRVDLSNLQRQILYDATNVGQLKLEAALARLQAQSPETEFHLHRTRLCPDNVMELLAPYDVVIDGTDNFATRYLVNDCCVLLGKPNVYGSIFRFDGQASVFYAPHGPCYRCLFPAPPPPDQMPNCAEGGVLGVLPGQIGLVQATEALKLILGIGASLLGRLMIYDAIAMRFEEFKISRDPNCAVCGEQPTLTKLEEAAVACSLAATGGGVSASGLAAAELIDVHEYARLRDAGIPHVLLDVRSPGEAEVCRIEGSKLIPVAEIDKRLAELDLDAKIIVYCKSGARSAKAVALLKKHGCRVAQSLTGGILAWIDAYDPTLTRY